MVHKELGKTKVFSHTIKEAQGRFPVKLQVMPQGWEGRTVNESLSPIGDNLLFIFPCYYIITLVRMVFKLLHNLNR